MPAPLGVLAGLSVASRLAAKQAAKASAKRLAKKAGKKVAKKKVGKKTQRKTAAQKRDEQKRNDDWDREYARKNAARASKHRVKANRERIGAGAVWTAGVAGGLKYERHASEKHGTAPFDIWYAAGQSAKRAARKRLTKGKKYRETVSGNDSP